MFFDLPFALKVRDSCVTLRPTHRAVDDVLCPGSPGRIGVSIGNDAGIRQECGVGLAVLGLADHPERPQRAPVKGSLRGDESGPARTRTG